jgi:hypothetical protein
MQEGLSNCRSHIPAREISGLQADNRSGRCSPLSENTSSKCQHVQFQEAKQKFKRRHLGQDGPWLEIARYTYGLDRR